MKRKVLLFTLVICTFLLFTQCDIFFYAPKLEYVITGVMFLRILNIMIIRRERLYGFTI